MKTIVRCKCGHRLSQRDVLRADLCDRTIPPNLVWLKYRCSRCKHMGEAFVAEDSFDAAILLKDRRELSETERDKFADQEAISADDFLDFRQELESVERVSSGTFKPAK